MEQEKAYLKGRSPSILSLFTYLRSPSQTGTGANARLLLVRGIKSSEPQVHQSWMKRSSRLQSWMKRGEPKVNPRVFSLLHSP
ncbi:hypothetical protein FRX31_034518 [Thalictrum thalictroides]|uniref:Uncharacterized protein n=1 Tax=Thalictrum thalictroides TaxID=46969 RepID=A0A7J6UUN6_THATH|nr:hypothetical protein FRX31_034518 [Thalictrum thalictroides]